jgi:hypothetical protein
MCQQAEQNQQLQQLMAYQEQMRKQREEQLRLLQVQDSHAFVATFSVEIILNWRQIA